MDTEAMLNKLTIRRARLDDVPTVQELIPLAYRFSAQVTSLRNNRKQLADDREGDLLRRWDRWPNHRWRRLVQAEKAIRWRSGNDGWRQ